MKERKRWIFLASLNLFRFYLRMSITKAKNSLFCYVVRSLTYLRWWHMQLVAGNLHCL
jgi:hypothetical protein